jgi:hypothetical protein
MPFLGLNALQWFVALDVGILISSGATAGALAIKLYWRNRRERFERALAEGRPTHR